jgi:predicted Zn-dependent protease
MDRMTERERYRTRGSYYLLLGNQQKCIEEYGTLIKQFPADAAAHNNLALCSTQLRDMNRGIEEVRQAAAILPKRALYRLNIALYTTYAGDFQTAEREARSVQELDPSYASGFVALAFAQLGSGQVAQASESYNQLAKLSGVSASNAAAGLGDLAIYEGRFTDAARILEEGAAADLTKKYADKAAAKFAALAYARLLQDQKEAAIQAADSALANSKAVKIRFLAGRVFALAGQSAQARTLAAGLASELQTEAQAYAKLIDGDIALERGDARGAITLFTEATNLLDTWIGRFELGRAYLEARAFTEADSEFDRCIKRRGEAMALFLDESPTYGYFPVVYYYFGRVREGMKSAGFADLYRTYLSIREKAGEDRLLRDVHKRL